MTKNPLLADDGGWVGEAPRLDEESLREFCAKQNRWAEGAGLDCWYRVVFRQQGLLRVAEVEKIEGPRAVEARAAAKGMWIEYFRTEGPEAEEIHAKVSRIIAANPGMSQAEFNRLVRQGRV